MDASAYLSQLIGLLPPGDALAREPGSVLERLLSVPAAELARVDGRVEALLTESDPARTTEMLADWERALGLPDVCYPNFAFSRASTAWYFDGAGVLREAAVDQPRYLYDDLGQPTDAVLVEAAGTNWVTNSRALGAVPGTPGTAPTDWAPVGQSTLVANIVSIGVEDDLPFVDIRWSGTTSANARLLLRFGPVQTMPVLVGNTATMSCFVRQIAGAWPATNESRYYFVTRDGALAVLADGIVICGAAPTTARLRSQRFSASRSFNEAGAAWVQPEWRSGLIGTGIPVDVTMRFACPQLELGAFATSPILNPISAPAVTTRAADNLFIATVEERRARILARLIERFEPTPAAIIGLAARLGDTVTLSEFRPHDCADDCEAPVLDEAWAHAFQVAGASQQVVEFTCQDTCETPLSQWRTGAYECAIRRFAPAQTIPIFSYA